MICTVMLTTPYAQDNVEHQTPRRRQRDPNFMGYTYKNFAAVPSSNGTACIPAPTKSVALLQQSLRSILPARRCLGSGWGEVQSLQCDI